MMTALVCISLANSGIGQQLTAFPEVKIKKYTTLTTALPSYTVSDSLSTQPSLIMQSNFDFAKAYHNSLGIFCKGENIISKKAEMNVRMRLGTLEVVDRMEGKTKY